MSQKLEKVYSISELGQIATVKVNHDLPIKLYMNSVNNLVEKADKLLEDNNLQEAYLYYLRYTSIVLTELPKHPEYNSPEYSSKRRKLTRQCKNALDQLEKLQPILIQRYQEYRKYLNSLPRREISVKRFSVDKPEDLSYSIEKPNARDISRQSPLISLDKEGNGWNEWSLRSELGEIPGNLSSGLKSTKPIHETRDTLNIRYPRPLLERPKPEASPQMGYSDSYYQKSPTNGSTNTYETKPNFQPLSPKIPRPLTPPPMLPPKPTEYSKLGAGEQLIGTEKTEQLHMSQESAKKYTASTFSSKSDNYGLRNLYVPNKLHKIFLKYAESNTKSNLETCGILLGKIIDDVLEVTTLIIPNQTATSDTCTTENEEEIVMVAIERDLIVFGWIHTHPSQTCFMSSLDLHTHCSYQVMLPEAIAIVCAPKSSPSIGFFRLTDPPGLDIIRNCPIQTEFHPHKESDIYMDVGTDSHVVMKSYSFDIIDLRETN